MASLLSKVQAITRNDMDEATRKEMDHDKERTNSGGGNRFKIPEDGKPYHIRVLPGFYGKSGHKFYAPLTQHWIGDGKQDKAFYCPEFHFEKPCPACEALAAARAREKEFDGAKEDLKDLQELIRKLLPQTQFALNIVCRADIQEGAVPAVRLFSAPKSVFQVIEATYANEGPGILDLQNGHDFIIKRSKNLKTGRTEYDTTVSLKPKTISDDTDILEDMLAKMHDLDKLVVPPKFEDFETAVLEMVSYFTRDSAGRQPRRDDRDRDDRPSRRRDEDDRPSRDERSTSCEDDHPPRREERDDRPRREEPERSETPEPEASAPRKGGLYEKLRKASRED